MLVVEHRCLGGQGPLLRQVERPTIVHTDMKISPMITWACTFLTKVRPLNMRLSFGESEIGSHEGGHSLG